MTNEPESVEALLRELEQEQIAQADCPDSHGRKHPSIIRELERINRVPIPQSLEIPDDLKSLSDAWAAPSEEDSLASVDHYDQQPDYGGLEEYGRKVSESINNRPSDGLQELLTEPDQET